MNSKKHFKMYKNGKKWCIMAIAALGITVGLTGTANADTTDEASVVVDNQTQVVPASEEKTATSMENTSLASQESSQNVVADTKTEQNTATASTPESTNTQPVSSVMPHAANDTNPNNGDSSKPTTGWKNENNTWTYYTNGIAASGRSYTYLPTINGEGNSWYLVDNGVVQSGVQQWAGTYYYFDPSTYLRVDNNYVKSQWGDWYMFGKDGQIASRVYQWANTYYYFDPVTYLRVDNDYRESQWGDWYLFGNDGRILSGVQQWAGTYYYFDPTTYLRVDNDYRQSQWGSWYLFGSDGRIQSGAHRWLGDVYYFDPVTYLKVTNEWREGLYYGSDGRLTNGNFSTRVIDWFLQRQGKITYSMYGSRTGADGTADCSGSMTMALRTAGASQPTIIYSTETLHNYLKNNGYYLAYEGKGQTSLQYGDVIIWGKKAASLGGNGHTMVATGSGNNPTVISTCYLTEGERGTAIQEVNYDWYWNLDNDPYQYVYRLANPARN